MIHTDLRRHKRPARVVRVYIRTLHLTRMTRALLECTKNEQLVGLLENNAKNPSKNHTKLSVECPGSNHGAINKNNKQIITCSIENGLFKSFIYSSCTYIQTTATDRPIVRVYEFVRVYAFRPCISMHHPTCYLDAALIRSAKSRE